MTPTRNGGPWNYCARCGARMQWVEVNRGFDRRTGKPGPNFGWHCPNWQPGERTRSHDASNTTVRTPGDLLAG